MDLVIATGQSRKSKLWKNTKMSWDEFVDRLATTTRTSETQGEYFNMTKSQQDDIKDVGGYVGGKVRDGHRKSESIENRTLLTLDADFASEDFCDDIAMFFGFSYCIYSTHKHTPEKPRYRLVIPLSRPCTPDEYEAVARMTAYDIGIDMFDDTTYQAHRLMYWPSTSIDGEYVFKHEENTPLDVDTVLGRYEDWHNVASWPVSSRTVKALDRQVKKQEDPTEKRGIIGTFCRTYDIHECIEKYLSDVYERCSTGDRYTYTEGSSSAGLVVYENGKFAYSNHATDPASGKLCNSFDLVRVHRFGDLDEDAKDGTPVNKLPSYTAMCKLANDDKDVALLMFKEKQDKAADDFADVIDETAEDNNEWILKLEKNQNTGAYDKTLNNLILILENDPILKGKISMNDFTDNAEIRGIMPWDKDAPKFRLWKDSDTSGLQWYLEHRYDISMGENKVLSAFAVFLRRVAYNPVTDYLDDLVWDGEERLDRLFIDYLGADDNEYTRAVTRKMLVGAVARAYKPGTKFDNMLILSGRQGIGKSTILRKIGFDKWFTDGLKTFEGKEVCELIQGKWIIEISELEALNKSEVGSVKQILSQTIDRYRAAYGRIVEEHPRGCVFFGTSNNTDYLRDRTGNRRFWPIDTEVVAPVKSVFTDLTAEEINQLWAEAKVRYTQNEPLYLSPELEQLAQEVQESHREVSVKEGLIRDFLDRKVPSDWAKWDLNRRREYWSGMIDEKDIPELVERDRICAAEIWCELFNNEWKYMQRRDTAEINSIIGTLHGWKKYDKAMRFSDYGVQKGFIKV